MKYLNIILLFVALNLVNAQTNNEKLPVTSSKFDELLRQDYKVYSDSLQDNVCAITCLGSDNHFRSYMLSSKDTDGKKNIFQIGSVSKLFVAHALCELVVSGDLKMETTLKEMLPFIAYKDTNIAKITLRQLANHTSGLPRLPVNIFVGQTDSLQPYENYTYTMLYSFLGNYTLVRKPGSSYEYSNLGVALLGHALDLYLQKHKNTSLSQYLKKEVFDKLDMKNTTLELSESQTKLLLQPYSKNKKVPNWKFDVLKWAGAYYSTSEDLAKFLYQFITKTPVFSKEVIKLEKEITFEVNPSMKVSYGWHITPLDEAIVYWHNGNTYGNSAFIGFTDTGKLIAVLSNSNRVLDYMAVDILSKIK
jgi:CubicO group peptidase (beta-lactamase class C family)